MADDGIIWVHLDDAEIHRCRCVLDEELGIGSYLGTVVWQKADGPRNDLPNFSVDHDTLLVYGRTPKAKLIRGLRDASLNMIYKSSDGDSVPWYDDNPTAPSAHRNQTWVYAIQSPVTGELLYPANGRCWATKQETVLAALSEYAVYELRVLNDDAKRAEVCGVPIEELRKGVPALMLAVPLEVARKSAEERRPLAVGRSTSSARKELWDGNDRSPTPALIPGPCGLTARSVTTARPRRRSRHYFLGLTRSRLPNPSDF